MKSRKTYGLIIISIIFCIFIVKLFLFTQQSKTSIHIAVVGPMSGETKNVGRSYLSGINMAVNHINKNAGINGKKIQLDIYDDQNDNILAEKKAKEIVQDNRALLVIGHNYSTCSITGGKIYKNAKIPAITPASSNIMVTQKNDWYFRITFDDKRQGCFLANYSIKVLKKKNVLIIQEDLPYGKYLADIFEETCKKLNVNIDKRKVLQVNNQNINQDIKIIVQNIKEYMNNNLLNL